MTAERPTDVAELSELGQAALQWAEEGVPVFPLHEPAGNGCTCAAGGPCKANPPSPGKHPRTRHGVKDATTDPDQIRRWWSRWPNANIGGAMGEPAGMWGLDVDGPDGEASLAERPPLPPTLTALSGRDGGGRHLFFRLPDGAAVGNRAAVLPGLDVRGTGGYLVLAPSLHPSGRRYTIEDDTRPADPPAWLLDLVVKRSPAPSPGPTLPLAPPSEPDIVSGLWSRGGASEADRKRGWVLAMVRNDCQRIRATGEGGRNDAVNTACYAIGGYLADAGLSVDDVAPELEAAAVAAEQPAELVRRALTDGAGTPRRVVLEDRPQVRWAPAGSAASTKAEIIIGPDLAATVDEVIVALAGRPDLFVHNATLVKVAGDRICRLSAAALRTEISRAASFLTVLDEKKTPRPTDLQIEGRYHRPVPPPEGYAPSVRDAGHWPGVRPLRGVSRLPPLRDDATAATVRGYDPPTELWYAPPGEIPAVPSLPTPADAQAAWGELLAVVEHFPFDTDNDRAAWLAGVMTPIAWPMYQGATPIVVVDAPGRDVGKSRLSALALLISTGAPASRKRWPSEPEEQAKVLATAALESLLGVLFDNVAGQIGGASLDAYTTAGGVEGTYSDRLLGGNTLVETDRPPHLWFSANNATFTADTVRRALSVRLVFRGEGQAGERELPALPTTADAPRLWALVVTILRAWVVAGRPKPAGHRRLSSFEPWSDVVGAAVHWATGCDPLASRARLAMVDETERERDELFAALRAWTRTSKFTAADAVRAAGNAVSLADVLREAGCTDRAGNLCPRALGYRLRGYRDQRDNDGHRLAAEGGGNRPMNWRFEPPTPAGRAS